MNIKAILQRINEFDYDCVEEIGEPEQIVIIQFVTDYYGKVIVIYLDKDGHLKQARLDEVKIIKEA